MQSLQPLIIIYFSDSMPKYIDVHNEKVLSSLPLHHTKRWEDFNKLFVNYDCEFQDKYKKMLIEAIGLYLPQINSNFALVYLTEELNPYFNPITNPLNDFGIDAKFITDEELDHLTGTVFDIFEEIKETKLVKQIKKAYKLALKSGSFDAILSEFNLTRDNLILKKSGKNDYDVEIQLTELDVHLQAFFSDVDLFKVFGKIYQYIFKDTDLESRRVLTSHKKKIPILPLWIEGQLYEVDLVLRDAMNRIPPLKKSLDNQCKIFGVDIKKLDIKTPEVARIMGLKEVDEIMANIDLLKKFDPRLFCLYAGIDATATHSLSLKQIEYINHIRTEFRLNSLDDIRDTTGSNVADFIKDLIFQHFTDRLDDTKDALKKLNSQLKLSHISNLQKLDYNNYGIQPLRTVGGLLYSRVQRYPVLKGLLSDLDEKSCYATSICNLNLYLGEPIVTTFKNKKYKPTAKETIDFLTQNCPRDGWFIRISGQLKDAINTLILSDLDFSPKKLKVKTLWDINPARKSIGLFNAFKTNNPLAASTLLTKEIKFGLINADLWECVQLLPDPWVAEFESLLVDSLVFVPNELICHSLDEFEQKTNFYPDDREIEKFNPKTGLKEITLQYSRKNLCLSFPIKDYYLKFRAIRNQLKKAKNPVQEVYKLFLNSGYGALACIYLKVNNLLAANQITASARATSWMMSNYLNAFQTITDGCAFSWLNIPLHQTFKEILAQNPNYLIDFDPEIKNEFFNYENANQDWIDRHFKDELARFYGVDTSYTPIAKFDFELKNETFTDRQDNEIKSTIFTDFYNTGSGNYSKGMNGSHILINGTEYDFYDFKKVKARSFKGENKKLLNWYLNALENGYKEPLMYSERQIIKFGEGNKIAIKFLENSPEIDEISHPMGFTRMNYKLMKLITRSQFLFKNEKQLVNFEKTNYYSKLDCLSKFIFTPRFWKDLKLEDLKPYGVKELKPYINYYEFSKSHPIGIGFELLSLNNIYNGDIGAVRKFIADKIKEGKKDFNGCLQIDRRLFLAKKYKCLFAAIIVLKANAEEDLKELLLNSNNEPTILTVNQDQIVRLTDLLSYSDE